MKSRAIRKLIPPVAELAPNIFVTRHIVDEVNRNKLVLAQRIFEDVRKRLGTDMGLPDFIAAKLDPQGKAKREWGAPSTATLTRIEEAISSQMQKIMESKDMVSTGLKPVFTRAVQATPQELELARGRKEKGNPPGKPDDPLGDQLNWEQLLAHVQAGDELWVVSRDSDYCVRDRKGCFLHSLFFDDLRQRGIKSQNIHVFDNLSTALKDFNQKSGVRAKKLPSERVLTDAVAEEMLAAQRLPTILRGVSRERVEKAIEALPPLERIVFVLHGIEGYQLDEIAEIMGASMTHIRLALAKSRRRLQGMLRA
jgi:RNA polymerase sigma factor (sigma-70 family)